MSEDAIGLLEIRSWSVAMAALDAAEKAGDVELLQVELNDFYGAVLKFTGSVADVRAAVDAGSAVARQMRIEFVADMIPRPSTAARPAFIAPPEFNVLIEQDVVHVPRKLSKERSTVSEQQRQLPFAIGMIETQGFTAVI